MSTYLLIHGAWHGGWCWRKVVPLLEAAGHRALAPDLPGHGEDGTPVAAVTLQSYVDRICAIAREQTEPVILVGHSMGGVPVTQAAESCPEHIRSLVYLSAFLPRDGESMGAWASQDRESMVNPSTIDPLGELGLAFKREFAREAFYGACSNGDVAFAMARLVDQPGEPIGAPVYTTAERWGSIPRYYIECARDRAISLGIQREMQKYSPCRQTFSIDTDHSPFLSRPEELARILLEIAEQ